MIDGSQQHSSKRQQQHRAAKLKQKKGKKLIEVDKNMNKTKLEYNFFIPCHGKRKDK